MKTKRIVALALATAIAVGGVTPAFADTASASTEKSVEYGLQLANAQIAQRAVIAKLNAELKKTTEDYTAAKRDRETLEKDALADDAQLQTLKTKVDAAEKALNAAKAALVEAEKQVNRKIEQFARENMLENLIGEKFGETHLYLGWFQAKIAAADAEQKRLMQLEVDAREAAEKAAEKAGKGEQEREDAGQKAFEAQKKLNYDSYWAQDAEIKKYTALKESFEDTVGPAQTTEDTARKNRDDAQKKYDEVNQVYLENAKLALSFKQEDFEAARAKEAGLDAKVKELEKKITDENLKLSKLEVTGVTQMLRDLETKYGKLSDVAINNAVAHYFATMALRDGYYDSSVYKALGIDISPYLNVLADQGAVDDGEDEESKTEESKKDESEKPAEESKTNPEEDKKPVEPEKPAEESKTDKKEDKKKVNPKKNPKTGDIALLTYATSAVLAAGAFVASKKRK